MKRPRAQAVYDALGEIYPPIHQQAPPERLSSGKVIVGMASLNLHPDTGRIGEFLPEGTQAFSIARRRVNLHLPL